MIDCELLGESVKRVLWRVVSGNKESIRKKNNYLLSCCQMLDLSCVCVCVCSSRLHHNHCVMTYTRFTDPLIDVVGHEGLCFVNYIHLTTAAVFLILSRYPII